MSEPLQTVVFKAKTTNSAPPPLEEPKPRSSDGPLLIAIFNSFGVGWILWDHPAIALVIAACVAVSSLAMRRSVLAKGASLIASAAVAFALITNPPSIEPRGYHYRYRAQAQRPMDTETAIGLYVLAVFLFGLVHWTVGKPDAAEAPIVPTIVSKPPEDPHEAAKKKGFSAWIASDRVTVSDKDEPTTHVDLVFASYKKYLSDMTFPPPPEAYFALSGFKAAFKSTAKKEPIDVKGEPHYQGVSLA